MLGFDDSPRWCCSRLRRASPPVSGTGGDVSTRWPGSTSYQGLEALRSITIQPRQCWSKKWCWSRSSLPVRYLFRTDQYSRIIFPLAFILVNCVYWCTVLLWFPPSSFSEIKQKGPFSNLTLVTSSAVQWFFSIFILIIYFSTFPSFLTGHRGCLAGVVTGSNKNIE